MGGKVSEGRPHPIFERRLLSNGAGLEASGNRLPPTDNDSSAKIG